MDNIEYRLARRSTLNGKCLEWNGYRSKDGYGRIKYKNKMIGTHRLAFCISNKIAIEDIPPGQIVMHICDNPPCLNPRHLVLGTQKDNAIDRQAKLRGGNHKMKASTAYQIKISLANGVNINQIAENFKVEWVTVANIARGRTWTHLFVEEFTANKSLGVTKPTLKENDVKDIKLYYMNGKSPNELADEYNLSMTNIKRILKEQIWKNIEVDGFTPLISKNKSPKILDKSDILDIRSRLDGNESASSVASLYDVSLQLIYNIKRGIRGHEYKYDFFGNKLELS